MSGTAAMLLFLFAFAVMIASHNEARLDALERELELECTTAWHLQSTTCESIDDD